MSAVQTVRHYLTLEHERDAVAALPTETRAKVRALACLAHQKRVAADAVRRAGSRGEALGILREAARLGVEAAREAGIKLEEELDSLRLEDALSRAEAPVLDRQFTSTHTSLYRELAEGYLALEELLTPFRRDDRERERLSTVRTALVLLCVATLASAGIARARKQPPVSAQASAYYGKKFTAESATDGDEATEWLLPDSTAGWLELAPGRPRPVRALTVLNAKNRPGPDRAIVDYQIEVFANGRVVRAFDGTFGAFSVTPEWKTIPLGVAGPIERVRINAKTWAGSGAGLAEAKLVY